MFLQKFKKNVKTFKTRNQISVRVQKDVPSDFWFFASLLRTVGYGAIWRVPFLAYETSPGAFIIIYGVSLFTLANSINFMEVFLGQYSGRTAATVYRLVPSAEGIGISSIIYAVLFTSAYTQLTTCALFYALKSFTNPLPWTVDATCNQSHCPDPALAFWSSKVVHPHSASIHVNLFPIAVITWVVIFLTTVKKPGKLFLAHTVLVIILAAVLIISRGTGLAEVFAMKPSHFLNPRVWERAIEQSLYSLGIGTTATITKGIHAHHAARTHIDCTIVSFTVFLFSILSASSSMLIPSKHATGFEFMFVTYPKTLTIATQSPLISILFFYALAFLGLSVTSDLINSISNCLKEIFPKVSTALINFCICFVGFAIGCSFMTRNGLIYFTYLDRFAAGYPLIFIAGFELFFVSFGYGLKRFGEDVAFMTGDYPNYFYRVCWLFGGFFLMLVVALDMATSPNLGFLITFAVISPIFGTFFYRILGFYQNGEVGKCFQPSNEFCPKDANIKMLRNNFKPRFSI